MTCIWVAGLTPCQWEHRMKSSLRPRQTGPEGEDGVVHARVRAFLVVGCIGWDLAKIKLIEWDLSMPIAVLWWWEQSCGQMLYCSAFIVANTLFSQKNWKKLQKKQKKKNTNTEKRTHTCKAERKPNTRMVHSIAKHDTSIVKPTAE